MGKTKVPLQASIDDVVDKKIDKIRRAEIFRDTKSKIPSKSKVVNELLKLGIKEYERENGKLLEK